MAIAVLNSGAKSLLLFGGIDEMFSPTNDVWQFDIKSSTFSSISITGGSTAPIGRSGMALIAMPDVNATKLVTFGGGKQDVRTF